MKKTLAGYVKGAERECRCQARRFDASQSEEVRLLKEQLERVTIDKNAALGLARGEYQRRKVVVALEDKVKAQAQEITKLKSELQKGIGLHNRLIQKGSTVKRLGDALKSCDANSANAKSDADANATLPDCRMPSSPSQRRSPS